MKMWSNRKPKVAEREKGRTEKLGGGTGNVEIRPPLERAEALELVVRVAEHRLGEGAFAHSAVLWTWGVGPSAACAGCACRARRAHRARRASRRGVGADEEAVELRHELGCLCFGPFVAEVDKRRRQAIPHPAVDNGRVQLELVGHFVDRCSGPRRCAFLEERKEYVEPVLELFGGSVDVAPHPPEGFDSPKKAPGQPVGPHVQGIERRKVRRTVGRTELRELFGAISSKCRGIGGELPDDGADLLMGPPAGVIRRQTPSDALPGDEIVSSRGSPNVSGTTQC
ncbi:hypothetical protein DMC30DRAFT_387205 [Rhodotorula diobovata]|uniref:Uncharacterized protein n=1 Tax=Rhodotorula diobovata TaxID=5288 RepID=A0A5C5G5P2_9BASI|nr:hypothetical protein DMC30DRAFT_387205 [Rhodotorula diobovata]